MHPSIQIKTEVVDHVDGPVAMVLSIIEASGNDGIYMDALTLLTSTMSVVDREKAINTLLKAKKLSISQEPGGLRVKVDTSTQISGSAEEQAIYALIEESSTKGIWIKELRDGTGLAQLQLRKVLKTLETKKMIKTIKGVGTSKKCYMLYNLEPDLSLTGGTFYSEQQLDSELINTLLSVSVSYIQSRKKHSVDTHRDDVQMQKEMSYIRPQEVADFIKEKRVLNVPLSLPDLMRILDVAILDGTLEKRADGKIRASPANTFQSALVSVPCSICPLVEDCRPGYVISPQTCEYMSDWLSKAQGF